MAKVIRRWELEWTFIGIRNPHTYFFLPAGNFEDVVGGDKLRGWVEFRGMVGSPNIAVAVETTNSLINPGTSTDAMDVVTSEGVSDPAATLKDVDMDGVKYMRPGFRLKGHSKTVVAGGQIRAVLEVLQS